MQLKHLLLPPSPKLNRSTTAIKLMACKTSGNTILFSIELVCFSIGGWLFNELVSNFVKGVKQNYFFQRSSRKGGRLS